VAERQGPPRRITPLHGVPVPAEPRADFPLTESEVDHLVHDALFEDRAFEDVTTIATVVSSRRARAAVRARKAGTVCGVRFAILAFRLLDDQVAIRVDAEDGTAVHPGDTVLFLSGHARGLLSAERTALNFTQRLSGIATLTAKYVEAVRGTGARVLDTRKTLPGWRALEKYAVRCGGGENHRMDLASAVLIKDNHLAAVDGDLGVAVRRCRAYAGHDIHVQVECDRRSQVEHAIAAGADAVLLDNMGVDELATCVQLAKGAGLLTEASGGVRMDTVRAIAETGVDRISIGAITHSAPALDLALDFE
jgi:nicotinate-nucleotide pyrophosphorylase (carboxylating)